MYTFNTCSTHDGDGGYMTVYVCQNSLNCTLKIGESFIYVKSHLNKVDE